MKHLHKFASVLLALVMALSLMVPAFATENETGAPDVSGDTTESTGTAHITVPDLSGHTYTAYQIFTGTQVANGTDAQKLQLADIKWGSGINNESFLTALIELNITKDVDGTSTNIFTMSMTADQVAEAMSGVSDADAIRIAQAAYDARITAPGAGTELESGSNTLETGYYLIVDTTKLTGENAVSNAALLQVVGDLDIKVKVEVPQVEKKVKEDSTGDFGKAADYAIGDTVPFQFLSAVPNMDEFEKYVYIFHDVMDEGLTFNAESVEVKIDGIVIDKSNYEVVTNADGLAHGEGENAKTCTFEIRFDDLKTVSGVKKGQQVVISFTATLNEKANVGTVSGNSNKVHLEYSNNPDDSGSGNPSTGETPENEVLVFTYELDTTKVDGQNDNKKLKDAEFHLSREVVVTEAQGDTPAVTETQWAVVNDKGKITRWVKAEADAEGYVAADAKDNLNGVAYAGSVLKSGDDGIFKVLGLDEGTYKLLETKAPAGYNTPKDPFTVTVTRDGFDKVTKKPTNLGVKIGEVKGTVSDNGTLNVSVQNNAGATLPETGGIGTTIFYIVGGLLTVGAVVLLVTKKRMSVDSDK